jgi:glyoxylase-like metal-dependent hydrolase (beta-lactamase superfamily II)
MICHCLLLEDERGLALVDTGIGLLDVRDPLERIGKRLIDLAGFQFHEAATAVRQMERLGFDPAAVGDIVLTHGDPDHAGGVADFPRARVHLSAEEHAQVVTGYKRYRSVQFAHGPDFVAYGPSMRRWFGLEARPIDLGFGAEVLLITLFGHTRGHCGVAVRQGERWLLHAGDAYYVRAELSAGGHPASLEAARRAEDEDQWRRSLTELQRLARDHNAEVEIINYHEPVEES